MTTKRTPIHRSGRARISPELRPMAERLLELHEAHAHAIRTGKGVFYEDGRHQELVSLMPTVNRALGINPWDDGDAILREALLEAFDQR